jgi:hypothetical protein
MGRTLRKGRRFFGRRCGASCADLPEVLRRFSPSRLAPAVLQGNSAGLLRKSHNKEE